MHSIKKKSVGIFLSTAGTYQAGLEHCPTFRSLNGAEMRPRREDKNRSVNERILILCEGGKTEPNYFNGIKRDKAISNRLAALRIHVHHTKKNTAKELIAEAVELIKEAKEEKNPYNSSWIIVDRDGYTKHPEAFDRARA